MLLTLTQPRVFGVAHSDGAAILKLHLVKRRDTNTPTETTRQRVWVDREGRCVRKCEGLDEPLACGRDMEEGIKEGWVTWGRRGGVWEAVESDVTL